MTETIESQKEELHRAQADERRRQEDHQLLHEQLLQQNWELREAYDNSLNEMEELKKFQSSTFDTIARDTILELTGKILELQNEINCLNDSRDFKNCMNDSRDYKDAEPVRSGNSTLPFNQCLSHLIQFLVEC